jgi:RHS repeat-associated protein
MHAFSYDPTGRTAQLWECQYLNCQLPNVVFSYDYDLSGDELDYFVGNNPHGSVEYVSTYNGAGRLVTHTAPTFVDATNPENLLTGVQYDPFGHMTSGNLANGLSLSWAYDARGRQTAMAVGTGCASGNCSTNKYRFTASYTPNSNIASSTDMVNGNWTYGYDGLNRLSTGVANNGEGCSWDYDRYGNRWHQNAYSGTCATPQFSFSGNNNRIDGHSYDADGNLLNDGVNNYLYDAENRVVSVDGGATTYVYDAEGRRFSKTTGGVATETIYDRMGNPRIRGNFGPSEIFVAGMHLGTSIVNSAHTDSIFYYDHDDWLGTERARTDLSGNPCETITSLPFGDGQTIAGTCGDISPMHFTGKERDTESGLDNFGARYNASSMGRFMTPDPVSATPLHLINPQRWNMYSYVINNPLTFVDPDGRDAIAVNFVNEIPVGGHEGIIVVQNDGSATYARFGPNPPGSSAAAGEVTEQGLPTTVQFQSNGLPTDASYKALAQDVAGIEKEPVRTVGFNYFKTSEAESIALKNWMDQMKAASDRGQAPDYQVNTQNCATFCIAGLLRANAIQNKGLSTIPNRLFRLLAPLATENWTWEGRTPKERVTHKLCDNKGQNCQ